jgi:hypothetical protein
MASVTNGYHQLPGGYWIKDSDNTGPYVHVTPGVFTAAMGGGGLLLRVSATSGVAPLGIVVDGEQSSGFASGVNAFHDVLYFFDFGDTDTNVFSYGSRVGESKNKHVGGPVSCYVYETPGTYTVTMWAYDGTRVFGPLTQTITATDPNTVYPGTSTVCVSTSGDFTGAPAGATLVTSGALSTILNTYATNSKRVLFRAGETFTAATSISLGQNGGRNDLYIGAFGAGAKPVLAAGAASVGIVVGSSPGSLAANSPRRWRTVGVKITSVGFSNCTAYSDGVTPDTLGSPTFPGITVGQSTVHDVEIEDANWPIISRGLGQVFSKVKASRPTGNGTNITLYAENTYQFGMIDCELNSNNVGSHNARLQGFRIASVRGYTSIAPFFSRHDLTARGDINYVSYGLVANSLRFDGSTNTSATTIPMHIGPSSTSNYEVLRDVIVENLILDQSLRGCVNACSVENSDVQLRNSVFRMGGTVGGQFGIVVSNPSLVVPGNTVNTRIRNLSMHHTHTVGFTAVNLGASSANTEISHVIAYAPNATLNGAQTGGSVPTVVNDVSAGGTAIVNTTATAEIKTKNPLWSSPGSTLASYALGVGSPYINAGAASTAHQDARGNIRNVGGLSDTGAVNSAAKTTDIWTLVP